MKALTLWPEWAAAIAHLGKDVENRGWAPPDWLVGQRLAIHAGKHIGGRAGEPAVLEARDSLRRMAPANLGVNIGGDALGGAWLMWAWDNSGPALEVPLATSAIVATARLTGSTWHSVSRWRVPGQIQWVLADVQTLAEPVPCRGKQGLWDVPADVLARVLSAEWSAP